jgi:integrase
VALRAKELSDSTVRQVCTVLRQALDVAVRDGLIASNPAAKVKRPDIARKEARYLSAADVARVLDAAKGLRYYLAVVVMATTGLRRGEVAGLLWSAVELDKGELMVRHTLSRVGAELLLTEPHDGPVPRRVPLHAGVVTQLRAHRTRQLQERLQAGDQWTDTGAVFATEFGTMVDPRNLLRAVEIAARKAGIEDVGAHTMRHSAAVSWLESGVHIKGGGGPARARQHRHHRRPVRAHQRRHGTGRGRRFGYGARSLVLPVLFGAELVVGLLAGDDPAKAGLVYFVGAITYPAGAPINVMGHAAGHVLWFGYTVWVRQEKSGFRSSETTSDLRRADRI